MRILKVKKKKILVAVSGGVDSTVLLHLLNKKNYKLGIIHINHLTRGKENIEEYQLVKKQAEKFNTKFYYFEYKHIKGNFHQESRKYRLQKYLEVVKKENYEAVILAHHFDDQIENILMNEAKISPAIMNFRTEIGELIIYRPLLKKYKKNLYKYAKKNKINYREDSSNQKLIYKRNKTRYNLKGFSKRDKKKIYNSELKKIKKYKKEKKIVDKLLKCDIIYAKDLDSTIKIYIFLKAQGIKNNISYKLLNFILNEIKKEKNVKITLCKNFIFFISYGKIYIYNKLKEHIYSENSKIAKENLNVYNGIEFQIDKNKIKFNDIENLQIRTYIPGDIWQTTFSKKVNRFFIDEKIDNILRKYWPIIVNDKDQIVYIPQKKDVKIKYKLEDYFYE